MSGVRVLVGTRKGAFILTADGARRRWTVSGPHFGARRRPFVRFFACEQDLSHLHHDTPLPAAVVAGAEPFLVVGAMAGG